MRLWWLTRTGEDGARRRGDAETSRRPLLAAGRTGGQLRLGGGARGAGGPALPARRPSRCARRLRARLDRDRCDPRARPRRRRRRCNPRLGGVLARGAPELAVGSALPGSPGGGRRVDEPAPSRCRAGTAARCAAVQLRRVPPHAADAGARLRRDRRSSQTDRRLQNSALNPWVERRSTRGSTPAPTTRRRPPRIMAA